MIVTTSRQVLWFCMRGLFPTVYSRYRDAMSIVKAVTTVSSKSMQVSIKQIIFVFGISLISVCHAENNDSNIDIKPIKVIEPAKEQRIVQGAAIDTESFEVGVFAGSISVEDFSANGLFGVSSIYHFSDRMLVLASYGRSDVDKATFEKVVGGSFLKSSDRKLEYFDIQYGYNLFPGRSFMGKERKYNSGIYLLTGIGSTKFAGDKNVTLILGSSYRIVMTDWLTWNIDFRDRIFNREFIDDSKQTHNIEITSGINVLF